jgi:ParB family chromosome partitioning protein
MTNRRSKKPRESRDWLVEKLRPHPEQHHVFDDLSDGSLDQLIDSIRHDGVEIPLDILPDGTVICGHQRLRAAKAIGLTKVPVIVRHDLAKLGEGAVLERLIADNLCRRQLDALSIARAYRALRESYHRTDHTGAPLASGDLRDQLGKVFGRSGRSLDRLERLLELPVVIQSAISSKDLSAHLAANLFAVDAGVRHEAAHRIAAGESPTAVVRELAPSSIRAPRIRNDYYRLLRELRRANERLAPHLESVKKYCGGPCNVLVAGRKLLEQLIQLSESA